MTKAMITPVATPRILVFIARFMFGRWLALQDWQAEGPISVWALEQQSQGIHILGNSLTFASDSLARRCGLIPSRNKTDIATGDSHFNSFRKSRFAP